MANAEFVKACKTGTAKIVGGFRFKNSYRARPSRRFELQLVSSQRFAYLNSVITGIIRRILRGRQTDKRFWLGQKLDLVIRIFPITGLSIG